MSICADCGDDYGPQDGSHYHCGRCHDSKPTSMLGHHVKFEDGWGFYCDEANLGKSMGFNRVVTQDDIRPPKGITIE